MANFIYPPLDKYKQTLDIFRAIAKFNLFDKKLDLDDPHFHHPLKDCKLRRIVKKSQYDNIREHSYQYCDTHQVNVCKCGWETGDFDCKKGWHYGTDSSKLRNITEIRKARRPSIDYNKGKCTTKDCVEYAKIKGLCVMHYTKYLRMEKKALKHCHYLPD